VLLLPLVGFLPADDERMLATIRAVEEQLGRDGLVRRWTSGFERTAAYANDVGLCAEEIDPETGEQIGNFPQAFSHVGLINAAWRLTEATSDEDLDDVAS
jgi:GH15 family glucan-1,4-alpha-glucosidase